MSTSHLFPSLAYQIAKCPMPRRDLYDRSPEREPWAADSLVPRVLYCFRSGIGVTGCEPPVDLGPGVTPALLSDPTFLSDFSEAANPKMLFESWKRLRRQLLRWSAAAGGCFLSSATSFW